jgi:hypothetical protein
MDGRRNRRQALGISQMWDMSLIEQKEGQQEKKSPEGTYFLCGGCFQTRLVV